ncbi:MAG: TspO/MBR family protein [Phocaeicola sp.]
MGKIESSFGYLSLSLIIPVVICLLVGFVSSHFQIESIQVWYPPLRKSFFTPPSYVFPLVWTFLYICMGISIGIIGYRKKWHKHCLVTLFGIQLFLNFIWSFFFFYMQSPFMGLVVLFLLDMATFVYIIWASPRYRLSAILFVPYFLWLLLASYLNFYIWYYN